MQDAYIVAYGRSAAGKAKPGGALFHERPDEVGAQVLKGVLDKIEGSFDYSMVDDVILGNAFPCLLYTSPSPRDPKTSRMPSSA